MAKDYAKYFSTPKKQSRNRFVDVILIAVLFLLIFGLIYAGYAFQHTQQVRKWSDNVKSLFSHKKPEATTKSTTASAEQASPESTVRFDFYTQLPAMKAIPTAAVETPVIPVAEHYSLELGVFKSQAEASEARVSLLFAGIEAEIVKDKTGYRLQHGSYIDKKQARMAQVELQRKGVVSVIRK
jgi:cell division protein FtsN